MITPSMRVYVWALCYAPRWLFLKLPQRWRHRQLRRWTAAYTSRAPRESA